MSEIQKIKPSGIFTNYIFKSIPLAFDESMSYYETLCALLDYLKTTTDVVNNNADLLAELESYVKNYFDDLDVQDEINNKLDEMVEQGQLQEIISEYLNSTAIFGFDNVQSMKNATNLINGSYAKTLGYYSKNDGGDGLYKIRTITNEDVVDERFKIALTDNTLIAELILNNSEINFKKLGLKANDNTFDNSVILNSVINNNNYTDYIYLIPNGTYYFANTINVTRLCDGLTIKGCGHYSDTGLETGTKLVYTGNDYLFNFEYRFWRCYLGNFDIWAENGSGIHFNQNIHLSKIEDIIIRANVIGIKVDKCGYGFFNRININDFVTSQNFIAYDFRASDVIEYLYMDECSTQIYSTNPGTTYGIYAYRLNHCFFTRCDFVNYSYGIYVEARENTKDVNIQYTHFGCSICCIYLYAYERAIGGVNITQCSFSIDADNAHVLETNRANSRTVNALVFDNNHIQDIINKTTDCLIKINTNSLLTDQSIINNNGYNSNTNTPFIDHAFMYLTFPTSHTFIRPINLGLNGDNSTATYTYTITTHSPFDMIPSMVISDSMGLLTNYTINNTKNGVLSVTLNFTRGWNGRNYIGIHLLNDATYGYKNINS